mmetsp:Transcript_45323/g.72883  ORF Transcript_45323/g.72883 Transcript_45323/m.72883 type:complete len:158 (+) Transcript_45323:59-532(+)
MNGPDVIVIEDAELNSLALEHELHSALEEEEVVEAHPCVKPDFQSNKSKNIKTSTPQNPCERDAEELLDEACENCVICMSALVGPPYSDPLAVSIECGHLFHRGNLCIHFNHSIKKFISNQRRAYPLGELNHGFGKDAYRSGWRRRTLVPLANADAE